MSHKKNPGWFELHKWIINFCSTLKTGGNGFLEIRLHKCGRILLLVVSLMVVWRSGGLVAIHCAKNLHRDSSWSSSAASKRIQESFISSV